MARARSCDRRPDDDIQHFPYNDRICSRIEIIPRDPETTLFNKKIHFGTRNF
jgi:hypothetical protein